MGVVEVFWLARVRAMSKQGIAHERPLHTSSDLFLPATRCPGNICSEDIHLKGAASLVGTI